MQSHLLMTLLCAALVAAIPIADGQPSSQSPLGESCHPISQRTHELGCWIMVDQPVGSLTKAPLFWHLDTYPTQDAANAAKGTQGAVVTSFGKVWLFTIETDSWQSPPGGEHVATIGPLPVSPADSYLATYMEAVFVPGMKSAVHDHPGPEAFYTLTGETCLETPDGMSVGRPSGKPVIVAGGLPMELTATGKEKRRGLVLVLHEVSTPYGHPIHSWTPKGLCK